MELSYDLVFCLFHNFKSQAAIEMRCSVILRHVVQGDLLAAWYLLQPVYGLQSDLSTISLSLMPVIDH